MKSDTLYIRIEVGGYTPSENIYVPMKTRWEIEAIQDVTIVSTSDILIAISSSKELILEKVNDALSKLQEDLMRMRYDKKS